MICEHSWISDGDSVTHCGLCGTFMDGDSGVMQPRDSESGNDGDVKSAFEKYQDKLLRELAIAQGTVDNLRAERDRYKALSGELWAALNEALTVGRVPLTRRINTAKERAKELGI